MLQLEEGLFKEKVFEMELFLFEGNFSFSIRWLETKGYYHYCFYFICQPGVRSHTCSNVSAEMCVCKWCLWPKLPSLEPFSLRSSQSGWLTDWTSSKLLKFLFSQPSGCVFPLHPHPKFPCLFPGHQKLVCQQHSPATSAHNKDSD